jgi:uncharacterized protein
VNASVSTPARPGLAWLAGGLAVGLLAASLAGPALGTARAQSDSEEPTRMISVTGTGRVFLKPDIADVSLGVVVQAREALEASQRAAEAMDAVIAALLDLGIAEEDIQTTQLSLNPVYDWNRNPPLITDWEANNVVRVTVRDVEQVGPVVDAAVAAGATRVDGVSFRVDDPTAAEAEARTEAVTSARAKADALAAAAGVTITGVLTISESSMQPPMPIYLERSFAAAEGMDMAATPSLPGQVEVQINVYITFSIE